VQGLFPPGLDRNRTQQVNWKKMISPSKGEFFMIQVKKPDIQSYHPVMGGDPLKVEKGWSHFTRQGRKDFLDYITGYEPNEHGI
jgi:hypothetical protein